MENSTNFYSSYSPLGLCKFNTFNTMETDKISTCLAVWGSVKLVLSGHSKRGHKIGFQDQLSLHAGQKYCRMLQESILQHFRPSLSYHLSLRPLFCLFLSGRLRQVLLNSDYTHLSIKSLHRCTWPHVAAAWRGVHCSLSLELTSAPNSNSSFNISSLSSIQHWN